jgi:hypothetical protein
MNDRITLNLNFRPFETDPQPTGVNLSGALLDHVTSGSITGTPAAPPTEWELVNGYLIGPNANLTKADWLMPTSVKQSSLEQTSPRPTSPRPTSPTLA